MTAQVKEMPSPFARRVGGAVRALMARHQVKQVELATVLGVNQSGISYRLSGRTPFDVNELATIARLFGMTVADLVQDAEQPRSDDPDRGQLYARRDSNPQPAGLESTVVRAQFPHHDDPTPTRATLAPVIKIAG